MNEKLFLVIAVDIDPELDREFNEWYDTVHLPEIVACPGFVSGRRAAALDSDQSPRYVTCYEVEHTGVLESSEIQAVRGWGPFAGEVRNFRRLWFRTTGEAVTHEAARGRAGA